jgi:hypothetical protein
MQWITFNELKSIWRVKLSKWVTFSKYYTKTCSTWNCETTWYWMKWAGRYNIFLFFTGSTAPLGPGLCFQFHEHFTDGRTPWTSHHLVARPLPKHRTTQTQNKHIHIPNIHALCWIRTEDPSFQASEDSSCLRPLGYCDRHSIILGL